MNKILELYGVSTRSTSNVDWKTVVAEEFCPYLQRKCLKVRKSRPEDTIGTCTTRLGLDTRFSTDANGIAECLGLQTNQRMELEQIIKLLGTKISQKTLFTL